MGIWWTGLFPHNKTIIKFIFGEIKMSREEQQRQEEQAAANRRTLREEYEKEYQKLSIDELAGILRGYQGHDNTLEELYTKDYDPHCANEWNQVIDASAAYNVFCEKYRAVRMETLSVFQHNDDDDRRYYS